MSFKGYEILETAIKEINVGKASAYHYLRNQRTKGGISESDFVKLTGNMIKEYKREMNVVNLEGYMLLSSNAIDLLKKRFGKKVEKTMAGGEQPIVLVNEISVNEDKENPKETTEDRTGLLMLNKKILTSLGYGEIIATEYAMEAVENNIDIVSFARAKATASRIKRIETKKSMLTKSFKRKGKMLEEAGYQEPYKVACMEFKKRFYQVTGFDLSLLEKKPDAMSEFLTEFNLWKVALKVAYDYEQSPIAKVSYPMAVAE